jgi:hypothetical protein
MAKLLIPQPVSFGLLLTYQCNASCRHCVDVCSPEWLADWISEEDIQACFSQLYGQILASPWGAEKVSENYGIHITGGEPFLNFELLLKAVQLAHYYDMPSIYVETNCFWCKDDKETTERLNSLKEAGLNGILISTSPFHLEFIPFEYTRRCYRISKSVFSDVNVMLFQQEYYNRFKGLDFKDRLPLEKYLSLNSHSAFSDNSELEVCGRVTYSLRKYYQLKPANYYFRKPCHPQLLRNWHNHLDNYGNLLPGQCGGITLGPWKELSRLTLEGIEMNDYPVLQFLLTNDMYGFFDFAKKHGYKEKQDGYISKCDLCLDIRTHLAINYAFPELQPEEFYQHVHVGQ